MRSRNCYVTDSRFKTINTNERVYNKLGYSYQEQRNYCWSPWLQRYQDKTQYLIKLDNLYRYDPIQSKAEQIGELRSSVAYRSNIIFTTMNSETFCIDKANILRLGKNKPTRTKRYNEAIKAVRCLNLYALSSETAL